MNTLHYQHNNENNSHPVWNVYDFSGTDANNFKRECDNDSSEALSFLFQKEITFDQRPLWTGVSPWTDKGNSIFNECVQF